MKRMNLLCAALVLAATAAAVPFANAAETKKKDVRGNVAEATTVHYIGAGSSAMWQGFGIAAYNDLAGSGSAASTTGICNAGTIQATAGSSAIAGNACTASHWTVKSPPEPYAYLHDTRSSSIPLEYGNLWVVWVTDTTTSTVTDVWTYLSVDSTVGVRNYLATPRAKLTVDNAATSYGGGNAISNVFFIDSTKDTTLTSAVWTAISGTEGVPLTAGMTDIRPEDAKLATERILGTVPSPYGGDTVPTTADNFIYSFALGYGPGPIGLQIKSAEPGSNTVTTPVEFALPGGTDPISSSTVSTSINVYPVGEAPIIFVANRTNTSTGLGQLVPNQAACTGSPTVNCLSSPYTSDGSYQYRNVWDQHPWPAQANVFPNLSDASAGYCSVGSNQSSAACHYTRRPLGNLFSGGDCETDNSAFTWPLDPNTQGVRVVPPNGTPEPITLFLREPLSGTYNTTEFSAIRLYGTPGGSSGTNGSGTYESTPYISQESNVVVGQSGSDPLDLQCPNKFGGENGSTEGFRMRGIGTGEVLTGPNFGTLTSIGDGVYYTTDSIAYAFFSFGNVSHLAHNANYGYLMIDGVDPLFTAYNGSGGEPGQPVNYYSLGPTGWGELPNCGGSGQPGCSTADIWGSVPSYPNLRNGSYPAFSELRMICDPNDTQTTPVCTPANDPLGAEALVQHLQSDIHNNNTGGVPDLLPFSDAATGSLSFDAPYGDVAFIHSHFNLYGPNDNDNAAGQGGLPTGNPWQKSVPPGTSTHQGGSSSLTGSPSDPTIYINFSTEACSTGSSAGGTPVNGPPTAECGGDAGGFIYPTGTATTGNLH
jgi:hypothetical protein